MPDIQDIKTSIGVKQLILDPVIHNATFNKILGGYEMYSGGFTAVFPCFVNGEKWAFRCWHTDLGNVRSRFERLGEAISSHPLHYFCEFAYVDEGIVVNGKTYPTTRMKWVDGMNIKDYVCNFRNDKKKLQALAEAFLQMCKDMHANHYSHGDLQYGNIIVNEHGEIFLIDYDSLYHTSMGEMSDIIAGLKDYQHPLRKSNVKASEKVDCFSEAIIYTAILAVAENPSLADKYDLEDSESMLFQAVDYEDFINSNIYDDLNRLGGIVSSLLSIISIYLRCNSLDELQPIEKMLESVLGTPVIISLSVANSQGIYVGDKVTISWEIKHAFEQKLNNRIIDISNNLVCETVQKDGIYTLTINNGIKSVSKNIQINVNPVPKIEFTTSTNKVRRGKNEKFKLKWNVKHAQSVSILKGTDEVEIGKGSIGSITLTTKNDIVYKIKVIGLDGTRVFAKQIKVNVFDAGEAVFNIDKEYSLPNVPIFIDWNIKHAKRAWIEGIPGFDKIKFKGNTIISLNEDTTFSLKYEDKFGISSVEKTVRMLPLPIVKSLIRPEPEFSTNVNVGVTITRPNVTINCPTILQPANPIFAPQIDFPMIGIDIPFVESILLPKENFLEKSWRKIKSNTYQTLSNLLLSLL